MAFGVKKSGFFSQNQSAALTGQLCAGIIDMSTVSAAKSLQEPRKPVPRRRNKFQNGSFGF
jgi:hypothetical protein